MVNFERHVLYMVSILLLSRTSELQTRLSAVGEQLRGAEEDLEEKSCFIKLFALVG